MAAISHDDSACKNPLLPDVRSRRLVFYRGENQKIPRSSAGSLRLPVDCIAFQPFRPLHHQRRAPREAEGLRWCLGALCMGMSMSRRNMTVGSNSDGADQSL